MSGRDRYLRAPRGSIRDGFEEVRDNDE